jgi:hypothetical protein
MRGGKEEGRKGREEERRKGGTEERKRGEKRNGGDKEPPFFHSSFPRAPYFLGGHPLPLH